MMRKSSSLCLLIWTKAEVNHPFLSPLQNIICYISGFNKKPSCPLTQLEIRHGLAGVTGSTPMRADVLNNRMKTSKLITLTILLNNDRLSWFFFLPELFLPSIYYFKELLSYSKWKKKIPPEWGKTWNIILPI